MPDVEKHGWTHRSKAEGGTDPIPIAASGLSFAYVFQGQHSQTADGSNRIRFKWEGIQTNDPDLFTLEDLSSDTIRGGSHQWANSLGISAGGFYMLWFQSTTGLPNAFNTFTTFIQPLYVISGSDAQMESSDFKANLHEVTNARNELKASSEWAHSGMHRMVTIWHDPAFNSYNPLEIACRVVTDKTTATTVGCQLVVVQMAGITPSLTDTLL